jgi:hypothetical protein
MGYLPRVLFFNAFELGVESGNQVISSDALRSIAKCRDPRDLSYIEMLCVLVMLATSDTGVTSPRPEHHRQACRN